MFNQSPNLQTQGVKCQPLFLRAQDETTVWQNKRHAFSLISLTAGLNSLHMYFGWENHAPVKGQMLV